MAITIETAAPLPVYQTEVDDSSVAAAKVTTRQQDDFGTTYLQRWAMVEPDGRSYQYDILRGVSAMRRPGLDLTVVKDTAWSTQVHGLNTDVGRQIMSLGFDFIIKGPEIGAAIPLSNSAHNTHKVVTKAEQLGWLDGHVLGGEGYSRGSMILFGTNAYAPRHGRQVIYSNLMDPCMANGINLDRETIAKALSIPSFAGGLALDSLMTLRRPARARHLSKTVDISPEGALQFVRTGFGLMNGEAGRMAAAMPEDTQGTVVFCRGCKVNDRATYRQILANHDGIEFKEIAGGHGRGIDTRIIGNTALRFGRLADQLAEGRTPAELDYTKIHRNSLRQAA